jgi:hypothetical protein
MIFDPQARAILAGLADVLIPEGDGMPSASQAGVDSQWLDAVLLARPDLAEGLREILLRAADRAPAEVVAQWRASDPAAFGILAEVVPGAYFMNPEVREALGYRGQTPLPIDPRPDYMEDDLLAAVIRRGPIYRPTPKSEK